MGLAGAPCVLRAGLLWTGAGAVYAVDRSGFCSVPFDVMGVPLKQPAHRVFLRQGAHLAHGLRIDLEHLLPLRAGGAITNQGRCEGVRIFFKPYSERYSGCSSHKGSTSYSHEKPLGVGFCMDFQEGV